MPSWVGDAVMATPALSAIRSAMPGAFIGALVRPGIDEVLAGMGGFDEMHVERAAGVMGPKRVAAKIRPLRYDASVLMTNSFSTALITRLAGIPRRIGYDRDGRGLLLTDRLEPVRRRDLPPFNRSGTDPSGWAPVPACVYYMGLADYLLGGREVGFAERMPPMRLGLTPEQGRETAQVLERAGVRVSGSDSPLVPFAVLNPGGNDPVKRWPPDRFAQVADHLWQVHGLRSLLNGSPAESGLIDGVVTACQPGTNAVALPKLGMTLGALKGVCAAARLMVTNDTGPRHIAAAMGVPVVSLFGPTDHRWTTIPFDRERVIVADPTLPEHEVANDHPERCAIGRIEAATVLSAADDLLAERPPRR